MSGLGRAGIAFCIVLVCCVLATGCGGSDDASLVSGISPAITSPPADAGNTAIELPQFRLDSALAELAALEAPDGVDPALFRELKDSMAGLLSEVGTAQLSASTQRKVSATDPLALNGAWCLDGNALVSGNVDLDWRGRHMGDYDLNGEVNVSDITPVAIYFLRTVLIDNLGLPVVDGDNELVAQVDGDGNHEVNAADLTPIALNYGSRLVGYRMYAGTSTDGENISWDADYIPDPDGGAPAVTAPWNPASTPGNVLRYGVGFNTQPAPGETLYLKLVPFNGSTEGPENVIPVPNGPHQAYKCSLCHQVTDLLFLGKENSCYGCHDAPPEDRQVSWDDTPGIHGECMGCHSSHMFAISPPETVCGNCHSSQAAQIAGTGMEACLNCHDQAHLPNAKPVAADCGECHTNQATELATSAMQDCMGCHDSHTFAIAYSADDCRSCHTVPPDVSGGNWASAPGLHANCESCHTEHNFAVAQPNSICGQCHNEQITGGHAGGNNDCLSCHNSPHIPEMAFAGTACEECHPNPPEDPTAEWTDAPGLHAQCGMCHDQPEHGYKPDPPESVCGNCHTAPITDGHPDTTTCLDCHTYPHLPVLPGEGRPDDIHLDHYQQFLINCSECHSAHGGGTWREVCGACHTDKVDHNAPTECTVCHYTNS